MMLLLVLLPLLAACSAQNELPLNATFDEGNVVVSWGLIEGTALCEIELKVNCTGWVGLMLRSPDGKWADVHVGGFDDDTGAYLHDMHVNLTDAGGLQGTPADDVSKDLILQDARREDAWTVLRFKRAANTGDAEDDVVIVGGNMTLGWAYSSSNSIADPADRMGWETAQLLPPAPSTPAPTTSVPTTAGAGSLTWSGLLLALCWCLL